VVTAAATVGNACGERLYADEFVLVVVVGVIVVVVEEVEVDEVVEGVVVDDEVVVDVVVLDVVVDNVVVVSEVVVDIVVVDSVIVCEVVVELVEVEPVLLDVDEMDVELVDVSVDVVVVVKVLVLVLVVVEVDVPVVVVVVVMEVVFQQPLAAMEQHQAFLAYDQPEVLGQPVLQSKRSPGDAVGGGGGTGPMQFATASLGQSRQLALQACTTSSWAASQAAGRPASLPLTAASWMRCMQVMGTPAMTQSA